MAVTRSQNQIISDILAFYKLAQPNLDISAGSVERDIFVNGPASEEAKLYAAINSISTAGSIKNSNGQDLINLSSNFGIIKPKAAKSVGKALITFSSLDADVPIKKGDAITAQNGSIFSVNSSAVVSSLYASKYKAVASLYQTDLDFLGIRDQFAVEVFVTATSAGENGNISKYGLISTNIVGASHVTNIKSFSGGRPAGDDSSLKNQTFAVFNGSSAGTDLGYTNAVLTDTDVRDVLVIKSGDPLMTRDGTVVVNDTIISEGTGGKIDLIVLGFRVSQDSDSYTYQDRSNTQNPANSLNDKVLGQIAGDEKKSISRRRIENLANGILPSQPINNLIQVTGTLSGSNFKPYQVDSLGRITGNYQLIKDTGAYAGSPFGLDRFHWISDHISDYNEALTKSSINSQDALSFTDLISSSEVTQNLSITNENSSTYSSSRPDLIQLRHFPVRNATRVFNQTTGESYQIIDQNPDGGTTNTTGKIQISGRSLPTKTDLLQTDYTWIYSFDPYFDFNGKLNPLLSYRSSGDTIDWGLSNFISSEPSTVSLSGTLVSITVTHQINSVLSVISFIKETVIVGLSTNDARFGFQVANSISSSGIIRIVRTSDGAEVWNTNLHDGSFSNLVVYLPTDTIAIVGDSVTITYNSVELFDSSVASIDVNKISFTNVTSLTDGQNVEVSYLANVINLLPATNLSSLPAIRNFNTFIVEVSTIGIQPTSALFTATTINKNLRIAPSILSLTLTGNASAGVITCSGTTITRMLDIIVTVSSSGFIIDFQDVIKKELGLNSVTALSSSVSIIRLAKAELVEADSNNNVLSSMFTYDLLNYQIANNDIQKGTAIINSLLTKTQIKLPSTPANLEHQLAIGNKVRVTAYYQIASDSESLYFAKAGQQYTQKKFIFVDTVAISSGFLSGSGTISIDSLTQPSSRSRYQATYDYIAPKPNERITIDYNYDQLIVDSTLAVESARVIDADVLLKASEPVLVSATMTIIVTKEFNNNLNTVKENVKDILTKRITSSTLNTVLDGSDLIQSAYQVAGVDRATLDYFNISGRTGSALTISAKKNQYIVSDVVLVEAKARV